MAAWHLALWRLAAPKIRSCRTEPKNRPLRTQQNRTQQTHQPHRTQQTHQPHRTGPRDHPCRGAPNRPRRRAGPRSRSLVAGPGSRLLVAGPGNRSPGRTAVSSFRSAAAAPGGTVPYVRKASPGARAARWAAGVQGFPSWAAAPGGAEPAAQGRPAPVCSPSWAGARGGAGSFRQRGCAAPSGAGSAGRKACGPAPRAVRPAGSTSGAGPWGAEGWRRGALPCSCTPRFVVAGPPRALPGCSTAHGGRPVRAGRDSPPRPGQAYPRGSAPIPGVRARAEPSLPHVRVTLRVERPRTGTSPQHRGICPDRPPTLR